MSIVLRDYQQWALADLRAAWIDLRRAGVKAPRIVLVSRTGTGKTILAGEFLRDVVGKSRRALFVVRDRVLIEQTSKHLDRVGLEDHGVIAAGHPRHRPAALVQVCSAQTLTARGQRPEADVLVIDEAHGVECSTSRAIVDAYPDATILGLTATPVRGDGKPLGAPYGVFQKLVQVQITFAELVAQGALVDCIVLAPKNRTVTNLTQKPIDVLTKHGRGRRVVVFGRDRKHAAELAAEAAAAGFRAASVHGESEDRDELLERIGLPPEDPRALDVLTNCDLLKQGWDSPRADMLILARGCSSFSQYMQICGRVLRPVPPAEWGLWSKPTALIFDLRGSVNKHGHPADDVQFSLEGKPVRRKDEEKLRQCPSCGAVFHPRPDCPMCGFSMASIAPRKPVRVERMPLYITKRRADMSPEELQALEEAQSRDYFDALCRRAAASGWKPAAVGMRWKARYGKWPPWPLPKTG